MCKFWEENLWVQWKARGKNREKKKKMAGGGRPQAGQVTGLGPSIQTGCLPVVLSSCSSETLTPCRTRTCTLLANPPRPQAAQQEHCMTVWLRFMKHSGWRPAIRGETVTCSLQCQQIASDLYFYSGKGLISYEGIFVRNYNLSYGMLFKALILPWLSCAVRFLYFLFSFIYLLIYFNVVLFLRNAAVGVMVLVN